MIISLYCLKYLKNMEWYTEDRNHSVPWYCIYDYYNVISTTATGVFVTVSNIVEEYSLALSLSCISRGLVDLFCTVKNSKVTHILYDSFFFLLIAFHKETLHSYHVNGIFFFSAFVSECKLSCWNTVLLWENTKELQDRFFPSTSYFFISPCPVRALKFRLQHHVGRKWIMKRKTKPYTALQMQTKNLNLGKERGEEKGKQKGVYVGMRDKKNKGEERRKILFISNLKHYQIFDHVSRFVLFSWNQSPLAQVLLFNSYKTH